MTDNITELLKEIEDIRIDGAYENLNDSLRTLVTQDQRLAAILDKAKISGIIIHLQFVACSSSFNKLNNFAGLHLVPTTLHINYSHY